MSDTSYIAQIAGLISFIGFIPYAIGILRKKVKPSFSTWFIWSVIGTILFISYFKTSGDLNNSIWVPLSYAVGPIIICCLSFKHGIKSLNYLDLFCLFISFSSLIVSYSINIFHISLLLSVFADFLGALQTVTKSYVDPDSEDLTGWTFFLIGNSLNILFIDQLYDYSSIYPLYLFIISLVIFSLLIFGRIKKFLVKAGNI